jgi:hypothetical protein
MKKLCILVVVFTITTSVSAQLKIAANGHIGIGVNNPSYKLDCNGTARFIRTQGGGDPIYIGWDPDDYWPRIYSTSPLKLGKSGNFLHVVYVNWLYYQNSYQWSDIRLKEDIKPLGNILNKLSKIESIIYKPKRDTISNHFSGFEEIENKETFGFIAQDFEKLFPELVLSPNSENRYYSVNYIGMIPVLVEAIKEQQQIIENLGQKFQQEILLQQNVIEALHQKVEILEKSLNLCCYNGHSSQNEIKENKMNEQNGTTYQKDTDFEEMRLYQNSPNPFHETTNIWSYIPQAIQKTELCIYNVQGIQVKCIAIFERGKVNVQIQANQLAAGIYTYLLIGDGKVSDAKQMILTK